MIREGRDATRQLFGFISQQLGIRCREVVQVFGDVKHAANFTTGTFRDVEKMCEILRRFPLETFRDVIHDGDRSPLNLRPKAEIAVPGSPALQRRINRYNLHARFLPDTQIFKAFREAHCLSAPRRFTFKPFTFVLFAFQHFRFSAFRPGKLPPLVEPFVFPKTCHRTINKISAPLTFAGERHDLLYLY
jgi:hypothetical protein